VASVWAAGTGGRAFRNNCLPLVAAHRAQPPHLLAAGGRHSIGCDITVADGVPFGRDLGVSVCTGVAELWFTARFQAHLAPARRATDTRCTAADYRVPTVVARRADPPRLLAAAEGHVLGGQRGVPYVIPLGGQGQQLRGERADKQQSVGGSRLNRGRRMSSREPGRKYLSLRPYPCATI
jgi:hypothetical protein